MRHIEGFVDRQTYCSEGHVWCVVLEHGGQMCYVWLILKDNAEESKRIEEMLQKWTSRELVHALEQGSVAIQREVNRFRSRFVGRILPVLCVYYQGSIFVCDEEKGALKRFQKPWGVYIAPDVLHLLTEQQNLEDNRKQGGMEQQAHALNRLMLKAIREGKLEQGYFLLWEDFSCFK